MALTKKELSDIATALSFLKTTKKFLQKESTIIGTTSLPNLLSYYNKDGEGITVLQKFVGSDLMYLINAIDRLEGIVESQQHKGFHSVKVV